MTCKDLASLWGISEKYVRVLCRQGKVEGAVKDGQKWVIPADVPRIADGREKSGKYKDWRLRYNVRKLRYEDFDWDF